MGVVGYSYPEKSTGVLGSLSLTHKSTGVDSAFDSTEDSGVLGLYPCEVRAFSALPPLNQRLGRSRPFSLHQSMGVPGFASI